MRNFPVAKETSLRVGRVWVFPTAAVNHNIGAYNWGRFGEHDRRAIEESLRLTLAGAGVRESAGAPVVRIAVARYMLAFTNSRLAVLAIVDWALEREGKISREERFFAAYDNGEGLHVDTLGWAKTRVNRAIVEYVSRREIEIVNGLPVSGPPSLIYGARSDALEHLPSEMTAVVGPSVFDQVAVAALGGSAGPTNFERNAEPPDTDWARVVADEKSATAARP